MGKIWPAFLILSLLFSCKTLPDPNAGELESFVSEQADPFLLMNTVSQKDLLEGQMEQLQIADPQILKLLEDSRWLLAGMQGDKLQIQLTGDFPTGKLKMGLGGSSDWEKVDRGIYRQGDLLLDISERSRILLSRGLPLTEKSRYFSLLSAEGEPLILQAVLGEESMARLRRNTPVLRSTVQVMEFQLVPGRGVDYQLLVSLSGKEGEERALNATGRVYLLSLFGKKVMEAEQFSFSGRVDFRGIPLTEYEWMEFVSSLMQGVDI